MEKSKIADRQNGLHGRRAFKFFESQHLEAISSRGSVRIGTASAFRQQDGYDGGRADEFELVNQWEPGLQTDADTIVGPDHPFAQRYAGSSSPNSSPMKIIVGPKAQISITEDTLLLCFSTKMTPELCSAMLVTFKCDMFYEVTDVEAYLSAIASADPRLNTGRYGVVSYDRAPSYEAEFHVNHFRKRPEFAWQSEARAVFDGSTAGAPFTIEVPAIRDSIRIRKNPAALGAK